MNLDELQARLEQVRQGSGDEREASLALDLLLADLSDADASGCLAELAQAPDEPNPELAAGLIKRTRTGAESWDAQPPPADPTVGPYRVLHEIARGGMGVVYEVEHTETGARYALKTLPVVADGEAHARARREVALLARLDHPNVVKIHTACLDPPHPYLVQDLLRGGSLAERLERDGHPNPLPLSEALEIAHALGEGLRHAHALDVVHRDLKPSNVLFDDQGSPRLVDFGLARSLGDATQRLTQTGAVLGTPAYIAPEQVTGAGKSQGRQTDVYGLGILLHTMLAGAPPFSVQGDLGDASLFVLLRAVIHQAPASLSAIRSDVPPDVARLVRATLEKDPAARPTLDDVLDALERLRAGEAVSLPRRHPRSWLLPTIVILTLTLVGLAVGAKALRARAQQTEAAERIERISAWDAHTLRPYGFGVTRTLELEALRPKLQTHLRALDDLNPDPDEHPRAAELAARLRAHLRLARHRSGAEVSVPNATATRAPAQLFVDALILRDRGAHTKALRRLDQVPGEAARTLKLALHAARGPAALALARKNTEARRPTGDGARLVLDALAPALRSALARLPESGDLVALRLIDDAARWLGPTAARGLAAVKRDALDASAAAWANRLSTLETSRLRGALEPLIEAALLAPRAEVGQTLTAALRRALTSHGDRDQPLLAGAQSTALDLLACDGLIGLTFGPSAALQAPHVRRLGEGLSILQSYDAVAFLACLRAVPVPPTLLVRLALRVEPASLGWVQSRWPESDALLLLEAIRRERPPIPPDRRSTGFSGVLVLDAVPAVRRALASPRRSDLHPRNRSVAHLLVAAALGLKIQHGSPTRAQDARAVEAHWALAFADPANRTPPLLYQGYYALAVARSVLGRDPHGIKTWGEAIAAFGGKSGKAEPPERTRARCDLALYLNAAGQRERALQVARQALAVSPERTNELHARAALCTILIDLGRDDQAWEVARPERAEVANYNLLLHTLDLLWARNKPDEARALLQAGLRRWPLSTELAARRERFNTKTSNQ